MSHATPFETDIAEQPAALRRLAAAPAPDLSRLTGTRWDRIVLTGMGSSYFAGIPTWRRLLGLGLPAWNVDAGQLLDNPGLITPGTLLVVSSQSGASGEIVELLVRRSQGLVSPALLVGIADDQQSPLATSADVFLPLHSGPEATVSTKSYLNTLGVHRQIVAAFGGESGDAVAAELSAAAELVEELLDATDLTAAAADAAQHPRRRLAYVGRKDEAATALFAALITKESSKVPAEGYIGGQFRHGPFELAGDGLTVVLFGMSQADPDESLRRLAFDLIATGSRVVAVGDDEIPGAVTVPFSGDLPLAALAGSSVAAQLFAVGLARANGVVPGEFLFGSKITTAV